MDQNAKRNLLAIGLGAAGTFGFYFLIEAYLDWFSLPWWAYLIFWLVISGSTHGQLLQDDANQKIVDSKDPE